MAILLPLLLLFGGAVLNPATANPFSANGDFWQLHYPVRALASENLRSYGQFPNWDPRTFGGYPMFGELSSQFFYPLSLAYGLVAPLDTGRIFLWLTVLHYAIGGAGTYLWLRGQGLSRRACVGGAWFCMLCAKWHAHALVGQHPTLGLAWLPWITLSIDRMRQRGAAEILPLTAWLYLWVASLSGQFVRDSTYFMIFYGFYSVYTSQHRSRQFGCLLSSALLSAGLSAFYLLPAFELLGQCTRSTGLSLDQAARGTWPLQTLPVRLLVPLPISDIGWEATLFMGVVAALLVLVAVVTVKDHLTRFLAILLAALLIMVMGSNSPLFPLFYKFVPVFKLFRYPERFALLLGWLGAPLVARGLESMGDSKLRIRMPWLLGLALTVLVASASAWGKGWHVSALSCLMLLVGLAVAWRPWPFRLNSLLVLLLAELLWLPASTVDLRTIQSILGDNALGAWLHAQARPGQPNRVWLSNNHMLASPYTFLYDLEVNRGINGYVPWVSYRLVQQGVAQQPLNYEFTAGIPNNLPIVSTAYLARGNYRFVASEEPLKVPGLELKTVVPSYRTYDFVAPTGYFQMPPTYVYENTANLKRARLVSKAEKSAGWDQSFQLAHGRDPARQVVLETSDSLPAFDWAAEQQPVQWTELGAHRRVASLEVPHGCGGAYLVVSEMYYPGWHARMGQRELPVYRADGAFCCVAVPEGKHEIEWYFEPRSYPLGRNISLGCLMLALGLGLALQIRSFRRA